MCRFQSQQEFILENIVFQLTVNATELDMTAQGTFASVTTMLQMLQMREARVLPFSITARVYFGKYSISAHS